MGRVDESMNTAIVFAFESPFLSSFMNEATTDISLLVQVLDECCEITSANADLKTDSISAT